jgi:5'-methylthioadenosine phosphorylase
MSLAIIGGTGLGELANLLKNSQREDIKTPYGVAPVVVGEWGKRTVIFLSRHGLDHTIPPHKINYHANIWALKDMGVDNIFASSAVGSLKGEIKPGDFVLVDQFIDFTKGRRGTFFDSTTEKVHYTDVTEPYNARLRTLLAQAAGEKAVRLHHSGVYVCTEGPRFETPAEIVAFQKLGGDVVGMTGVPEVVLANELEISYASLAVATNYAAGIAGKRLTFEECLEEMKKWNRVLFDVFMRAADVGRL